MTARSWRMTAAALAVPMVWGVGLAYGQQERETQTERRQTQREEAQGQSGARERQGQQAQRTERISDQEIAAWLIIDNVGEVQMAQLAQKQAQNEQVKQFAQQMIKDHSQFAQKLQQAAGLGQQGQQGQTRTQRQPGDQQPQQPQQPQQQAQRGQPAQPGAQGEEAQRYGTAFRPEQALGQTGNQGFVQFHHQVSQKCLKAKQQMLQRKQGAEFDKAYMTDAVAAHVKELATLQIAQQQAQSQELKQVLEQGEQTVRQHLEHAIALHRQVEQQGQGAAGQQGQRGQSGRQGARQNNQGTPERTPQPQ